MTIMKKKMSVDLVVLLLWPIIAALVSYFFKVNLFVSILIFFIPPVFLLSIRMKNHILKALLFSLVSGIPIILVIDYLGQLNQQWTISASVFAFKFFGVVTIELVSWIVLNMYFVILFYEYFLDNHVQYSPWNKRMNTFVMIFIGIFVIFTFFLIYFPIFLKFSYFYLISNIVVAFIPAMIILAIYKKLIPKVIKVIVYFFYFSFIYEIVALKLQWWGFPDSLFIGWIHVFGISFPVEELLAWFIALALITVCLYEFFADDRK